MIYDQLSSLSWKCTLLYEKLGGSLGSSSKRKYGELLVVALQVLLHG